MQVEILAMVPISDNGIETGSAQPARSRVAVNEAAANAAHHACGFDYVQFLG
jgi:hypothetical protein